MNVMGLDNGEGRGKDSFLTEEEISIFSLYCEQFPACMGQSVSKVFGVPCIQIVNIEEAGETTEVMSSKKIIVCEICEKSFATNSSLRVHKKKHEEENGLACQICDMKLSTKADLDRHSRIHIGAKPYACPECSQTFTTKGHLTDHYRKHSGERPFVCHCGKAFSRSSILKKHSFIHTGEKPLLCEVCGKGFIDSGNLKIHLRTHTNERPFKCPFIECGKSFKTKAHLQEHLLIKAHTNKNNQ